LEALDDGAFSCSPVLFGLRDLDDGAICGGNTEGAGVGAAG